MQKLELLELEKREVIGKFNLNNTFSRLLLVTLAFKFYIMMCEFFFYDLQEKYLN